MAQKRPLRKAVKTLFSNFTEYLKNYSIKDFLKSGVDPFRFKFNVAILGSEEEAVKKEVKHKLEMKLENMFGDFHENYLSNGVTGGFVR